MSVTDNRCHTQKSEIPLFYFTSGLVAWPVHLMFVCILFWKERKFKTKEVKPLIIDFFKIF